MKKLISLVLLLALATTLLCACGETAFSTDSNTETIGSTVSAENTENTEVTPSDPTESKTETISNTSSAEQTDNAPTATESNSEAADDTSTTDANADNTHDSETPSTENKEFDISIFPEVKVSPENIDVYRQEVKKRRDSLGEDEFFVSDEEWEVISNSESLTGSKSKQIISFKIFSEVYGNISEYIHPVVYRDGDILVLWFTNESGKIFFRKLHGIRNIEDAPDSNLHINISDIPDEEIIKSGIGYVITYVQKTGEFKVWQYGKVVNTYSVPKNSIYCGFSHYEGHIFINGSDVYAIEALNNDYTQDVTVNCIAHNVKQVIEVNYEYSDIYPYQPLFRMNDGSVKCYIHWEGDENAARDDPSLLFAIEQDGFVE